MRRLVVPGARGIHRTTWDLRGTGPALPPAGGSGLWNYFTVVSSALRSGYFAPNFFLNSAEAAA